MRHTLLYDNAARTIPREEKYLFRDHYTENKITNRIMHCTQHKDTIELKRAGSRNVNKLLSKRRLCSIFDRPYHSDFPLLVSKLKCYFEEGLFYLIEKQTKRSYVARLQRYWWIFGSNFSLESPHGPKSVQNTVTHVGNNIDSRDNGFVYGYVTLPL